MTSRRRPERHPHDLPEALAHLVERVRPHARTVAVIAGVAIIGVVVLVWLPIMRSRAAANAAYAFNAAVRAGGPEALRTFLDGYPDADQGSTARLLLADRLLRTVAAGHVEPDDAEATLDEAEAFYTQVAKASKDLEPMARTGLALVTLQRGDLDEGRKALEQVTDEWPQSVAAARAKAHLEVLAEEAPPESGEEVVPAAPAVGSPAEAPAEVPAEEAVPATPAEVPAEETEESPKPVG